VRVRVQVCAHAPVPSIYSGIHVYMQTSHEISRSEYSAHMIYVTYGLNVTSHVISVHLSTSNVCSYACACVCVLVRV